MKLYELPAAFAEVEAMLIDGELDDAAMSKLAELEGTLAEKVQSCLCVSRNFSARATARKAEADRLSDLAATDAANEKRLKKYVEDTLNTLGVDTLETDLFKVRFQKNPPAVKIDDGFDLASLPEDWLSRKVEPNKKAILSASKATPLPEGISITQTRSMRVS